MQLSLKSVRGAKPNCRGVTLLYENSYAVSDQPAHQTELFLVFWCFEILTMNKDHCKNNGAKRPSGWRDMQTNKLMHFPCKAPIYGTDARCVQLVLPFLTQDD
jgi:hypothetical protein